MRSIAQGLYPERFVENGIELSVLWDPTDQDPREADILLGGAARYCARSAISALRLP
jgi:hypothetical protein